MFHFEKFPVYLKAEHFYKTIIRNILNKKNLDKHFKDQLKRAASSITLNIAEGAGRFSKNDKKNFYVMARGSTQECVAVLRLLTLEKIINKTFFHELHNDLTDINKMLSGLINKMGIK